MPPYEIVSFRIFAQKLKFWPTISKNHNFGQNISEFRFVPKMSTLKFSVKNRNFGQKLKFRLFCPKLRFLPTISIFVQNYDFCPKLRFLPKISFLPKFSIFSKNSKKKCKLRSGKWDCGYFGQSDAADRAHCHAIGQYGIMWHSYFTDQISPSHFDKWQFFTNLGKSKIRSLFDQSKRRKTSVSQSVSCICHFYRIKLFGGI